MKAKEFIPSTKPRNFVAKNQKTSGAGAHKDKKKAAKQGDVKHKARTMSEDDGLGKKAWNFNKKLVKGYNKITRNIPMLPGMKLPTETEARIYAQILDLFPGGGIPANALRYIIKNEPELLNEPSWIQKVTGLEKVAKQALDYIENNKDDPKVQALKAAASKKIASTGARIPEPREIAHNIIK